MALSNPHSGTEQQTLTLACEAFSESTRLYRATPIPATRESDLARTRIPRDVAGADAWIRFTIAGKHFDMPVSLKTGPGSLGASIVVSRMLTPRIGDHTRPLMLVTQHVSPRLAEILIDNGIPFLDTAGNAYLQEPEATVMIVGRAKPTLSRMDQTSRSTTPKGLRVTFAVLTQPGLVHAPYRMIADQSGVALNTVNVAMDDLMDRGLVVQKDGRRVVADRRRLIADWVTLFPTRLRPKLSPLRFTSMSKDQKWWGEAGVRDLDVRLGGEAGADILTHEIKPASLTLYSHAGVTPRLVSKGMLRPDLRGNVEVLDAFWPVDAEGGWHSVNRGVVHPLLVYADLIISADDRNHAVAQTIYERYLDEERA